MVVGFVVLPTRGGRVHFVGSALSEDSRKGPPTGRCRRVGEGFSYPCVRLTRRLPAHMLWELPVEEQPSEHRPGTDGFRRRVARPTHLRLGFLRVLQNAI